MSNINRNNYEAFLLDYMEQNLSPDEVAELMLFLEQNPDLQQEFDEMEELTMIEAPAMEFPNKEILKKEALENLMIAEVEGINTPEASSELQKAIADNKENEKAFVLYQKTILQPENIVFANKEDLKRKEGKVIPLYWWAASAAAILVMVFLLRGLNNTGNVEPSNFADNEVKSSQESVVSDQQNEEQNAFDTQHPTLNTDLEEEQLANSTKQETRDKKQETKHKAPIRKDEKHSTVYSEPIPQDQLATNPDSYRDQQPATSNQQLATSDSERDSIIIAPMEEEEVLLAENQTAPDPNSYRDQKKPLTIPQYLKKELNKKVLKNEEPEENKPTEVVVADILAKAAGKRGSVNTKKNNEGQVEEYALNIGGFSFSRKVRK